MKKIFFLNPFLIFIYLTGFTALAILLLIISPQFESFYQSDVLATFWYFITVTGSPAGFISVVFLTLLIMMIDKKSLLIFNKQVIVFFASVIFMQAAAVTGLQIMKSYFKIERPFQQLIIEKGLSENHKTLLHSIPDDKISDFLESNINKESLSEINSFILDSWLKEKAYSFPSGHAQTSFFAAIVLSFVILKTSSMIRKYLAVIPVIWCVLVSLSRVFAGFHYPADVIAGAFIGLTVGILLVSFEKFSSLI